MKENFIEHPLKGRGKLTYDWLPSNIDKLLDIGCSYGYYTRFYLNKCKEVYGIDPNEDLIKIAKKRYPRIKFKIGDAEKIPFKDDYFDVILLSDVLEHVNDEEKAINEVYRVLKNNGVIIITVPHKGLFRFMDVDNYSWCVRNKFPNLYKIFNKIRKKDINVKPGYEKRHKHYSIEDIKELFKGKFKIIKLTKRGLFLGPFVNNFKLVIRILFRKDFRILDSIKNFDYNFNYGKLSGSLAVKAIKLIMLACIM